MSGVYWIIALAGAIWGYKTAQARGANPVLWAIFGAFVPVAPLFLYLTRPQISTPQLSGGKQAGDFFHEYKGTAISIDRTAQTVSLRSIFDRRSAAKTYMFSDVRSWHTNISSGGNIVGGSGIAATAHNIGQARRNEAESGLFITVRDIDYPEWRIAFAPNRNYKHELNRWTEIFRQTFEEND